MNGKKMRILSAGCVAVLWLVLTVFAWFGAKQDVSETERRKLETFPTLNAETLLDGRFMSRFETYTQDQFPLREQFRQLKAVFHYDVLHRGDNNGIYLANGYAAKLEYPLNLSSVESALKKFQRIYDLYLGDVGKILFSVVPDKGYYLAEANGYPAMDYSALFGKMASLDWAEYVDLADVLSLDSYYRTDTHWRQEALLPAARKLGEALGVSLPEDYRVTALERPFYGVYYGQAALPMEPETMYLLESDILAGCTVTNYETGKTVPIYNPADLDSRDLYDIYLGGAVSVLTIDTPAAETDRELIVFRDSFGSSIVPLLVPGYAKITLLDIRYVPTDYLPNFVTFGNQDVLFLYSPLVLNNSTMLK